MRFRSLYWVLEQVERDGRSHLAGVFTSIPDLISIGLKCESREATHQIRLSLVKLDAKGGPLRSWCECQFGNIADDLLEYVRSRDFSLEEVALLVERLREIVPEATRVTPGTKTLGWIGA